MASNPHARVIAAFLDDVCDQLSRRRRVEPWREWTRRRVVWPAAVSLSLVAVGCGGKVLGAEESEDPGCTGPDCTEQCIDGADNDLDGRVDCADPDCELDLVCAGWVCNSVVCLPPNCSDGHLNQDETDIDCGGGVCEPCEDGLACLAGDDCLSQVCENGLCQPPTCTNGIMNGEETGIDCGGPDCPTCGDPLYGMPF